MEPLFLGLDDALMIHQDQLALYGGQDGIRDMGLLTSALAQPQASYGGRFLHEDLAAMAASYLFHVVQNHPFLDGNKRTGAMCAYAFLGLNGYDLDASEPAFEELVWQTARGELDSGQVADFIRAHLVPLTG